MQDAREATCPECGAVFPTGEFLTEHIRDTHEGVQAERTPAPVGNEGQQSAAEASQARTRRRREGREHEPDEFDQRAVAGGVEASPSGGQQVRDQWQATGTGAAAGSQVGLAAGGTVGAAAGGLVGWATGMIAGIVIGLAVGF